MPKPLPELRKWLIDRDTSRRELAQRLGYAEHYIHAILCGQVPVSPNFVAKFTGAYGPEAAAIALAPHASQEEPTHVRA